MTDFEWAPASAVPNPGVCRYNIGTDPKDDCGQPGTWHVRYARSPSLDTPLVVMTCDAHLGFCLRPQRIDGEVLADPSIIHPVTMHEVKPGTSCVLEGTEPTWWIPELNICVNEEEGIKLGVMAYESKVAWPCGVCGEMTRVSHYRTNSDGSTRHDPFGVNHTLMPDALKHRDEEWQRLFSYIGSGIGQQVPCDRAEPHAAHGQTDAGSASWCPGVEPGMLVQGLCGNREDHAPHYHPSSPSGAPMWCHADQSRRLPHAAEVRRKADRIRAKPVEEAK